MKRVLFIFLFMFLFMFSCVRNVFAEEITYYQLPTVIKQSLTYNKFLYYGVICGVDITDDTLKINCDLGSEGNYSTIFNYDGGNLTYKRSSSSSSSQKWFDTIWILQLSNNFNGYFGIRNDYKTFEQKVNELSSLSTLNSFSVNIERGNNDSSGNIPGDNDSGNNDSSGDIPEDNDSGNNNQWGDISGDNDSGNNNQWGDIPGDNDLGNSNQWGDIPGDNDSGNNNQWGDIPGDNDLGNNNQWGDIPGDNDSGNNNSVDNNVVNNPQTGSILFFVIFCLLILSLVCLLYYKNKLFI